MTPRQQLDHLATLAASRQGTGRVDALCELAWEARLVDPSRGLQASTEAVLQAQKLNYVAGQTQGHLLVAVSSYYLGDGEAAAAAAYRALEGYRALKDVRGEALTLNWVGNCARLLGDAEQALANHGHALALHEQLGDDAGRATALSNLCHDWRELQRFAEALDASQRGLALRTIAADRAGLAMSLHDVATCLQALDRLDEARHHFERSLKLARDAGLVIIEVATLQRLGALLVQTGDVARGIAVLEDAAERARAAGAREWRVRAHHALGEAYAWSGQLAEALTHTREAGRLERESLQRSADTRLRSVQALYQFESQARQAELERLRNVELAEAFQRLRDSLNYAEGIQRAVLPDLARLGPAVAEAFVLFEPLDVVSGDFYWARRLPGDGLLLAVCDATGHGVPGGLLSMLGLTLLNQLATPEHLHDPAALLAALHAEVRRAFAADFSHESMDAAVIGVQGQHLTFAGARLGCLLVDPAGDWELLAGERHGVGQQRPGRESPFSGLTRRRTLAPGTMLYLATDGWSSLPGGDGRPTLGLAAWNELLRVLAPMPAAQQAQQMREWLAQTTKAEPLRDDATLLGLRVG